MRKVIVILFVLIFAVVFGFGEKTLKIGTSAGFKPFEYKESGKVVGFDIDLITAVAKQMKMKVEILDMDFDALIEAVKTGTIDVVAAGMTINGERKKVVDFSNSYFVANQSVLVKKKSKVKLKSAEDVDNSNYKIGVQNDTTGAIWADDHAPDADIKKYSKYIECIQDLENGNLDMIVLDKPVAEAYAKNRPVVIALTIKTDEEYGFAVKKGSPLLSKINKALKKVKKSKTWDALFAKYF